MTLRFAVPAIVFFVFACEDPDTLSYEEDIASWIETKCISCHNPNIAEAGLDLMTNPFETLLEQHSNQSTYPLVTPGNVLESYLWHKLNGTQSMAGGSGTSMPLGVTIDDDDLLRIEDWIQTGCQP